MQGRRLLLRFWSGWGQGATLQQLGPVLPMLVWEAESLTEFVLWRRNNQPSTAILEGFQVPAH